MRKKIISLLLAALFIMSSVSASAAAVTSVEDNPIENAKNYAMSKVTALVQSGDEIVNWDDTTKISSYVELYGPDDNVNGYIFKFETAGEPSGFMQIGVLDSEYYFVSLGEGDDFLTKMLAYNDMPASKARSASKTYYLGGFEYCVYDDDDNLFDLETGEIIEADISSLKPQYDIYQSNIEQSLLSETNTVATPRTVTQTVTVSSWSAAAPYLKSTAYYTHLGYHDHCTPTAATNLVMYWKYVRGYFKGISSSQLDTFKWFYNKMETNVANNGQNGTQYENILPPLKEFFSNNGGASSVSSKSYSGSNLKFSNLQALIDKNIPFLISGYLYQEDAAHTMNAWGYNSGSDFGNCLFITDNLDNSDNVSFSLVEFSTFNDYCYYIQSDYVGLN